MTRRCFSETPIDGPSTTLGGGEAHHLLHVLRAAPGMQITLFDGSGREFDAEVATCGRSSVELLVHAARDVDRELPWPLVLGVALPKGDRQRWIVEKAVELGVTRLVPLATERAERQGAEKLSRYVVEASKQCGRNRLMEISEPQDWQEWLHPSFVGGVSDADDALRGRVSPKLAASFGETGPRVSASEAPPTTVRRWVAHPGGRGLLSGDLTAQAPTFVAIGPEGGLADAEVAAAQAAGWELIGLGPRLLRIETAAIALVSALTMASGSQT